MSRWLYYLIICLDRTLLFQEIFVQDNNIGHNCIVCFRNFQKFHLFKTKTTQLTVIRIKSSLLCKISLFIWALLFKISFKIFLWLCPSILNYFYHELCSISIRISVLSGRICLKSSPPSFTNIPPLTSPAKILLRVRGGGVLP